MNILVRTAEASDLPWIRRLAVESGTHTLPKSRKVSAAALSSRVQGSIMQLSKDPDCHFLVAYEEGKNIRLGYLILLLHQVDEASGEPQSTIYDVAVEPKFRGGNAIRCLIKRAAQVSREHGFSYLSGEVTADNRRAYLQALRLGFALERYQIVMPLDSQKM